MKFLLVKAKLWQTLLIRNICPVTGEMGYISPYQKQTNKKQKLSTTMTSNLSSHKSLQLLLENKPTMTKRYLLPNCGGEEGGRYLKFSGSDFCPCPIFTELCCWQVTETSSKILSKLPSQRWFTTMINLGISVWVKQWSIFSKLQEILLYDQMTALWTS